MNYRFPSPHKDGFLGGELPQFILAIECRGLSESYRPAPRHLMTNEDTVLDEIQDNTREAGQRLRASLNLLRSQGLMDEGNFRELTTRLSTALAMTEAAYLEARRRRDM